MRYNLQSPDYQATQATQARWRAERTADAVLTGRVGSTLALAMRKRPGDPGVPPGASVPDSITTLCNFLVDTYLTTGKAA